MENKTYWLKCSAEKYAKKVRKAGFNANVYKNNWYLNGGKKWGVHVTTKENMGERHDKSY